jgi:hypothetical protein
MSYTEVRLAARTEHPGEVVVTWSDDAIDVRIDIDDGGLARMTRLAAPLDRATSADRPLDRAVSADRPLDRCWTSCSPGKAGRGPAPGTANPRPAAGSGTPGTRRRQARPAGRNSASISTTR